MLGLQDVLDQGDDGGVRGGRGRRLPGILHLLPVKESHETSLVSASVLVLRLAILRVAGWDLDSSAVVVDGTGGRLCYRTLVTGTRRDVQTVPGACRYNRYLQVLTGTYRYIQVLKGTYLKVFTGTTGNYMYLQLLREGFRRKTRRKV